MMFRSPLIFYYVWAIIISWTIATPLILRSIFNIHGIVFPYHHFLVSLGPIAAAFLSVWQLRKPTTLKKFWQSIFNFKIGLVWYGLAFSPLFLFLASLILNQEAVDFTNWQSFTDFGQIGLVSGWLIHVLTFGLGEEVGWRGYLLPQLLKKHNPFIATVILTLMWGFWHIPMFFYRSGYLGASWFFVGGWLLSLFMGALFLTWLYEKSGRKVVACIIFHGTLNTVFTLEIAQGNLVNTMGAMLSLIVLFLLIVDRKFYFSSH